MMDHTSAECLMSCSRQSRVPPSRHLNILPSLSSHVLLSLSSSLFWACHVPSPSARNLQVVGGHSREEHYQSHLPLLSNDDAHDDDHNDDGSYFLHKIVKSSPSRRLTHNLFAWNSIFIQQKLLKYSLGGLPNRRKSLTWTTAKCGWVPISVSLHLCVRKNLRRLGLFYAVVLPRFLGLFAKWLMLGEGSWEG